MKIALKFALVLCAATMIFGACGGKNAAVTAFEDYANSVCACKDVKCATDATNAFQKKAKDLAKSAGSATDADKKAVAAATEKMTKCMKDLATGKAKKAAPAKKDAPAEKKK